jgi:hypothetical protein
VERNLIVSETPSSLFQLPNETLTDADIERAALPAEVREAIARAEAATLDLNSENDGLDYLNDKPEFRSSRAITHADTLATPAETPEVVRKFNKDEIAQVTINIADCLRPAHVAAAERGLTSVSLPQQQYKHREDYALGA